MSKLYILFFAYLLITLALTIHCTKSSSISSKFYDGPITNKSIIELSKNRSKRYSPDSEDRIVGGQFVKDFRKYPFMVYVRIKTSVYDTFCGGTLISRTHILTAAHCLKRCHCYPSVVDDDCFNCTIHKAEHFTIYFGNIVAANSKVTRTIKNVYRHPEYKFRDFTHKCVARFDIAVLELGTPVRYSQRIARIKLPKPVTQHKDELISTMTSSFFDTKKKCTILGWGAIAFGDPRVYITRRLKVAAVPLIGNDRCIHLLYNYYQFTADILHWPTVYLCTDTSICSKSSDGSTGTCTGDSGGPIICNGVQVGVVSWGCDGICVGPNRPNIYSRVDINVQWIRSIMSNKHDRMEYEN